LDQSSVVLFGHEDRWPSMGLAAIVRERERHRDKGSSDQGADAPPADRYGRSCRAEDYNSHADAAHRYGASCWTGASETGSAHQG
jgi:hypothetical protein